MNDENIIFTIKGCYQTLKNMQIRDDFDDGVLEWLWNTLIA